MTVFILYFRVLNLSSYILEKSTYMLNLTPPKQILLSLILIALPTNLWLHYLTLAKHLNGFQRDGFNVKVTERYNVMMIHSESLANARQRIDRFAT